MRGGKEDEWNKLEYNPGSPPHARGKVVGDVRCPGRRGITPACAGKVVCHRNARRYHLPYFLTKNAKSAQSKSALLGAWFVYDFKQSFTICVRFSRIVNYAKCTPLNDFSSINFSNRKRNWIIRVINTPKSQGITIRLFVHPA